jgi:uncharacterized phage protein (TIGR01671 family)
MKIELELRGWSNHKKKMYKNDDICCIFLNPDTYNASVYPELSDVFIEPIGIELIFMQYIGVIDKHNKRIFENDILKMWDDTHKEFYYVKVERENDGWWINGINAIHSTPAWPLAEDGEIIGNIYENPELLTGYILGSNKTACAE